MVVEVFGNILYYPPDDTHELKELPSPEQLKGRVLLSTKPPKEYLETKLSDSTKEGDADLHLGKGTGDDAVWGKEVPDFRTEIQSAEKVLPSIQDLPRLLVR
jgi:phosphatidylinositol phospholipase C, delta